MRAWRKSGSGRLITAGGRLLLCDTCPCGAQLVGDVVIAIMNDNSLPDDGFDVELNGTLLGTHDGDYGLDGDPLLPGCSNPTPYTYFTTVPTFDGSLWTGEIAPDPTFNSLGVQRFHVYVSPALLINGTNTLRCSFVGSTLYGDALSLRVFRTAFNGTNWTTVATASVSNGSNSGNGPINFTGFNEDSYTFTYPF